MPTKSNEPTPATSGGSSLFAEFKAFALKGNVIDLAIGVIIGAAFGKIISSLVTHVIMPLMAAILPGEQGYLAWKVVVGGSEVRYGLFLGEVVNFLVIALALFIFLKKFLGWLVHEKQQKEMATTPPLSKEQELLTEIRDLLKQQAEEKPTSAKK